MGKCHASRDEMLGEILFKSEESIQGLHIKPMTLINKVKELKYRFFHSDHYLTKRHI